MATEDVEGGRGGKRGGYYNGGYATAGGGGGRVAEYYEVERAETGWTSWIVPMFVVANVAVFIATMFVNNCPGHAKPFGKCVAGFLRRFSFQPLRENPLFGPSSATLQKLGALEWNKVVHGHQGWRLVTCIWLHAGVIHLLANMLSLIFIGIRLEQQFGFVRIGIIYLLSGFGGSVLSSLFIRNSISAAALFSLLVIVLINLAVGILPHVDNFAHIGGFVTGFLLGFILLLRPQFGWMERHNLPPESRVKSKHMVYQYILWVTAMILLIAGLAVGLVMLFRGINGNDRCHWCHYLSCVPTSRWQCGN
ncbi:hypothetical protein Taro_050116 [Colocasia esculenta]|uniref:RHOMBOID-like protein n=1 Tax=Colocasia esculenta TaxID=4460 RepID=A0A843XCM8_COLES|nr:hypothetical protein [Colocasia esculenta]